MKKIIHKTSIYKVQSPYNNWYSIMTYDGLNRSNIIIAGKKQLLKVKGLFSTNYHASIQ